MEKGYNLKYSPIQSVTDLEYLVLYFVGKTAKEVIRFNPVYRSDGEKLKLETIAVLLSELDIRSIPYEKRYPKDGAVDQYRGAKYPFGVSGYLPGTHRPIITINPTTSFKQFVLMHEVAHILLKHSSTELSQVDKEMEANITAFLVLNSFNSRQAMLSKVKYFDLHLINIPLNVIMNSMITANKILGILKEGILHDFN